MVCGESHCVCLFPFLHRNDEFIVSFRTWGYACKLIVRPLEIQKKHVIRKETLQMQLIVFNYVLDWLLHVYWG